MTSNVHRLQSAVCCNIGRSDVGGTGSLLVDPAHCQPGDEICLDGIGAMDGAVFVPFRKQVERHNAERESALVASAAELHDAAVSAIDPVVDVRTPAHSNVVALSHVSVNCSGRAPESKRNSRDLGSALLSRHAPRVTLTPGQS